MPTVSSPRSTSPSSPSSPSTAPYKPAQPAVQRTRPAHGRRWQAARGLAGAKSEHKDRWRAGGRARTLSDERVGQRCRSLQRHTALIAAAHRVSNLRRATMANGRYARAVSALAGCAEDTSQPAGVRARPVRRIGNVMLRRASSRGCARESHERVSSVVPLARCGARAITARGRCVFLVHGVSTFTVVMPPSRSSASNHKHLLRAVSCRRSVLPR
jgi:hypothetical protein